MTASVLMEATDAVRRWLDGHTPRVAVVLGSGAAGLAAAVSPLRNLPYARVPGFPLPDVPGHSGQLFAGTIEGVPVILQSGRFHRYEGHDPSSTALPVRVFAELGIEVLIVTNAAGAIRSSLQPPTLMLIADHMNLTFGNPLIGRVQPGEGRFPDMSAPYDVELRRVARRCALEAGISVAEGVYAGVTGPSYETRSEIRMLMALGADAVGMSTVPEVIAARARGLKVLGISLITNLAAGVSPVPLSHADVLAAGGQLASQLEVLMRGIIGRIPAYAGG